MKSAVLALLPGAVCCFAREEGDFKPASLNVLDAQYPKVDSTSRVQIRFKAPEAAEVRIDFWTGPKDFARYPPGQSNS